MTITQIIDLSCTSQSLQSVDAASVHFIFPFFLHENYQQAMFIFYIQGLSKISITALTKIDIPGWRQLSILFYLGGGQGLRTQTCCINIPTLPALQHSRAAASDNNNKRVKYDGGKPTIFLSPPSHTFDPHGQSGFILAGICCLKPEMM